MSIIHLMLCDASVNLLNKNLALFKMKVALCKINLTLVCKPMQLFKYIRV